MSSSTILINPKRWTALLARLTAGSASDHAATHHAGSEEQAAYHPRSSATHVSLPPAPQLLIATAIHGTLLWEASSHQAKLALNRLAEYFADFNDLRAAPTLQILPILGERYPLAIERISRLLSWMNHLYRAQQSIDLEHLRDVPRKDARHFLLSLEGMPLYAADHTALQGLGVRTIPIDERLAALLAAENVIHEAQQTAFKPAELASLQEQLLEATPGESMTSINAALRAWSDHDGVPPKREPNNAFAPQREFTSAVSLSISQSQAHGSPSHSVSVEDRAAVPASVSLPSSSPKSVAKKKTSNTKKAPKAPKSIRESTSSEPSPSGTEYFPVNAEIPPDKPLESLQNDLPNLSAATSDSVHKPPLFPPPALPPSDEPPESK